MKHVGEILKMHIEASGIPKQDVAAKVGIAYNYLSAIFNKPSIKCDLLEKFCQVLHISPLAFFEVDESDSEASYKSRNTVWAKRGKAELHIDSHNGGNEALLAEKERVIASQAETISILKQMLGLNNPGNGTDSGQVN